MRGNLLEVTQNSILRIPDKKTIELIEEYKKEECLWNTALEDYPLRDKRVKAANRIAKKLNIPHFEGKHVMIKFKNLRNSYCQELKKIQRSLETVGTENLAELYRPKVRWFPLMDSFIRPHLHTSRPSSLNQPQPTKTVTEVKMEYESDGQDDWSVPSKERSDTSFSFTEYTHKSQSETDDLSNDSPTKRRERSVSSKLCEPTNSLLDDEPGPTSHTSKPEDTYEVFGRYIASLLRNLPPTEALKLQPKIVNMIVDVGVGEGGNINLKIERLDSDSSETDQ